MQNNTKMFSLKSQKKDQTLSVSQASVKTFLSETQTQKVFSEKEAKLFLDVSIYAKPLNRILSYLKTPTKSREKDLNLFYADFPKSGMMLNGKCYHLPALNYSKGDPDYMLLPAITKSDYKGAVKKRFFRSPFYKSNLTEFLRDGETDGAYPNPELYEALMDLKITRTELRQ